MTRWVACALVFSACGGSFERRLTYEWVASTAMGREMELGVWAPPDRQPGERLPLIVFLHGGGDDAASFDRFGLSRELDAAVLGGRIPRVVIALPQGELGFWANWYDGSHRYEDWVVEDVMPHVAARYQTQPCPDGCHLMGVSMGGSGALRIALHHPRRFASATMISAPIFDTAQMIDVGRNPLLVPIVPMGRIFGPTYGSAALARIRRDDPFIRWQRPEDLGAMRLMVAWGSRDRGGIADTSRRFVAHLDEHGVPHDALEFEGDHSWRSWGPVVEEALRRMVVDSP